MGPAPGVDAEAVIADLIGQCRPYGEKEAWGRLQTAIIDLIDRHLTSDQVHWTVSKAIKNGLCHLAAGRKKGREKEEEKEKEAREEASLALQTVLDVLLPLCLGNNGEAWEVFASGVFFPLVEQWTRRLLPLLQYHNSGSEDISQSLFIKFYENQGVIEQYDKEKGPFKGWLYRIVKNALIDEGRREGRRRTLPSNADEYLANRTSRSVLDDLVHRDEEHRLNRCRKKAIKCVGEELQELQEFVINPPGLPAIILSAAEARQAYIRCLGGEKQGAVAREINPDMNSVHISRIFESIVGRLYEALRRDLGEDDFAVWLNSALNHDLPERGTDVGEGVEPDKDEPFESSTNAAIESDLWKVEKALHKRLWDRHCKRRLEEELEKALRGHCERRLGELPSWRGAYLRVYVKKGAREVVFLDLDLARVLGIGYAEFCVQLEDIHERVYKALRKDFPKLRDNLSGPRG